MNYNFFGAEHCVVYRLASIVSCNKDFNFKLKVESNVRELSSKFETVETIAWNKWISDTWE